MNDDVKKIVGDIVYLQDQGSEYDLSAMSKLLSKYSKIKNVKKDELRLSLASDIAELDGQHITYSINIVDHILSSNKAYISNKKSVTPHKIFPTLYQDSSFNLPPISTVPTDYYGASSSYNVTANYFGADNPLNIHLVFYGEIPKSIKDNICNTITNNPDNNIMLWTNKSAASSINDFRGQYSNFDIKDMNELIAIDDTCPDDIKEQMQSIRKIVTQIMQSDSSVSSKGQCLSDIMSLLATYKYGGLYLDADVVVNQTLDKDILFAGSDFKSHLSITNNIEGYKAYVDYYDVLGFKDKHDSAIKDVLTEMHDDLQQGYMNTADQPGELVRIVPLMKARLKDMLGEDTIDEIISEAYLDPEKLDRVIDVLNDISITQVAPGILCENQYH